MIETIDYVYSLQNLRIPYKILCPLYNIAYAILHMQYYALCIMYQKVHLLFIEIAEVAVEGNERCFRGLQM